MSEFASTAPAPPAPHRFVVAPGIRLGRILWRLMPWLSLALVVVGATWVLGASAHALTQIALAGVVVIGFGLLLAIVTETLSPDRADLRLIPVSDARAQRIAVTLRVLLFFLLLTRVAAELLDANDWHPGVADLLDIVRNIVLVLAGAGLLGSTGFHKRLKEGSPDTWLGTMGRFTARVLVPLAVLTLFFCAIAAGLGYEPLATYVAENAGWSTFKLLILVFVYRMLRRLLYDTVHFYRTGATVTHVAGTPGHALPETDAVALGILNVGGGGLKLIAFAVGFLWIASEWDVALTALGETLDQPILGTAGITWGGLLGGIAKVVGVLLAGWLISNALKYFVFPRTKLGVGARYAILAVLRYVVIAIAIVIGLGALGVDTSSLSWFFGAAGIGIAART